MKYSTVDFTSEYIEKIFEMLDSKLLFCIDVIERFYLLTIKSSNDEDNDQEKDIIEKNAEQEYFKALCKVLDGIVQLSEFKSFFSQIIISDLDESTKHLIWQLEAINSLQVDTNKIKLKLYYTNLLGVDILKISDVYREKYAKACDNIHTKMVEIINNKNFKKEIYNDTIQMVHDSKNKGDFDKANKYLDDIMKELTNN